MVRADQARNRAALIAAAADVIAVDGADASLEEIARRAGVGSATLHRHFPSRRALWEAVFHDRVVGLCVRAGELSDDQDGLVTWLGELAAYSASARGLALALLESPGGIAAEDTCHGLMRDAAGGLLERATAAGTVRPGVDVDDLLRLVSAISFATEGDEPGAARLLDLAVRGLARV
ncbi:TetR/AcrR family transcriptional regulator [Cryptosporangium phraense]|uniref:Helix-turn-helix transcriptional regulator n=1 Tax=Cryptosporangium phraense TaxID=2593070 RepID=A0A545AN05_9ACTN|nr:helix-turn-helix domain-containing protein [Cryptosporangium phraense]TQS42707.1 helix-turn-helix transcriptional regulator [Cryptosporangium phraense]